MICPTNYNKNRTEAVVHTSGKNTLNFKKVMKYKEKHKQ